MQRTSAYETTTSYYEDYYETGKRKLKMDTVFPFFALSNLCLDVFHLNKGEERRENCKEDTVVVLQDTIEKKDGKILQATYHSIVDEVPYDFTIDFNVKKRKIDDHDTTSSSKAFKNASGEHIKLKSDSESESEPKHAIIKTEPGNGKGDHLEELQFKAALERSKLPERADYHSKTSTENYEAEAEAEAEAEDEAEDEDEAEVKAEVKAEVDRKSTRLNSSHSQQSRMPSSA